MDWNAAIAVVTAVAAALGAGLSIWNFLQSPTRQVASDLSKVAADVDKKVGAVRDDLRLLDGQHDDTKARVASLEHVVKTLPDKDSLHRIEMSVAELNTRFASMAASAESTERTARRVEQYLLEHGKG